MVAEYRGDSYCIVSHVSEMVWLRRGSGVQTRVDMLRKAVHEISSFTG